MTTTAILRGARVRVAQRLIGAVERVEPADAAEGSSDEPAFFLVQADDGTARYRFPLQLVASVGEESDQSVMHTVVQLALAPADLDRYAVRAGEPFGTTRSQGLGPGTAAIAIEVTEAVETVKTAGEALRVPVYAETLVVETRPVRRGIVRLHTSVETAEQRLMASLAREEVTVERIPVDQYDVTAPTDPDETIIPIREERAVVETRTVVVAYLRVRKRRVTEQQEVRAPVRREVVTVQEYPATDAATAPLVRVTETSARPDADPPAHVARPLSRPSGVF